VRNVLALNPFPVFWTPPLAILIAAGVDELEELRVGELKRSIENPGTSA
jgi:hypothetical protein